jgi:hypothetical protein
MWHIPAWIWSVAGKVADWFLHLKPKRPRLEAEIRQVCFDKILASLDVGWGDYTIDLYIFLRVWVVNQREIPTTVKQWKLTVVGEGKSTDAELIEDISRWHQHMKVREQLHGMDIIRDIRDRLVEFPAQPLQHGIPVEGWICFLVRNTRESLIEKGYITLTVVDSFGHKYRVTSKGPWPCKGDIVNPQMLY